MSLAEYTRLCNEPSDINGHLPRFVAMVEELDAQHVIELGTRTGVSTIAWLYALSKTGGRLTSVDVAPRPPIGRYDNWTFVQGDDCSPEVTAQLDPADIVFIDTSHTYEHTLSELTIYQHLVRAPGLIVCHDTMLAHPLDAPPRPAYPVRKAIEEFCASEGLEWYEHRDCWGLGVIRMA